MRQLGQNTTRLMVELDRALSDPAFGDDLEVLPLLLEPLRPWSDVTAVQRALTAWAEAYDWQVQGDGIAGLAAELQKAGCGSRPPSPDRLAGFVLKMLINAQVSGDPADDRHRLETYVGSSLSKRTVRRYRSENGPGATRVAKDRIDHSIDVQALMARGRSRKAASEWLRRNKGKHWPDAPPPRRRRSQHLD